MRFYCYAGLVPILITWVKLAHFTHFGNESTGGVREDYTKYLSIGIQRQALLSGEAESFQEGITMPCTYYDG